jgi:hypothetical protein
MKRHAFAGLACLALFSVACGGSDGADTGPTNTGPELSYLSLFPESFAGVVGSHIILQATARDLAGTDVPDPELTYTVSDSNVARLESGGIVVALEAGTATVTASAGGQAAEMTIYVGDSTYDLEALGPPRVLSANYIDLSKIGRVSRFRSTAGHSYVDASGETCRSMKHYFEPKAGVDWTTVDVYAPTSGTIFHIAPDGIAGYRVLIAPRDLPVMDVQIFHVNLDPGIVLNSWVEAGDHLGTHASSATTSDIATSIGGKELGTLLSYFEVMTDAVFAEFQARGIAARQDAIITKEERDADPVPCTDEEQFTVHGTLPDWLELN